jgi:hypothetical protein
VIRTADPYLRCPCCQALQGNVVWRAAGCSPGLLIRDCVTAFQRARELPLHTLSSTNVFGTRRNRWGDGSTRRAIPVIKEGGWKGRRVVRDVVDQDRWGGRGGPERLLSRWREASLGRSAQTSLPSSQTTMAGISFLDASSPIAYQASSAFLIDPTKTRKGREARNASRPGGRSFSHRERKSTGHPNYRRCARQMQALGGSCRSIDLSYALEPGPVPATTHQRPERSGQLRRADRATNFDKKR